ncbi:serine/threonine-protein kinase [Sphaerisporangium fuscum]|uniref:serine/threonine-protein kinase n=1 Tax=Sphaerisporangium fuscum TaxID=2835868 RepID=UPI001BDC5DD1|nr:serine/threonine-protein kinase [Sphaerisporangium fuscum]
MADSETSERVVAGRYRLAEPLGHGGMGIVWRAVDELLGREVAVKELHGSAELSGPAREMFIRRTFREARAAGRLSHPGVAAVYDVFEEDGHPWIVMQMVPSRTLGAVAREDGPLPPRQVARVGLQVLAALRAAHEAGVLHRDVKPDNVLITADGQAVLTDFGVAVLDDDSAMTGTGVLIGTPAFIAPERAQGGKAQRASDLWSLGVTMFMAVEGRSPFQRGNVLGTLAAVLYQDPGPLLRAGPLAPVIEGLLVKDPAARMTAAEAARWLEAVAADQVTEPVRTPVRVPGLPWLRGHLRGRSRAVLSGVGASVLVAGLAVGAATYVTSGARSPTAAALPVSTPTVTVFQTATVPADPGVSPSSRPMAYQRPDRTPRRSLTPHVHSPARKAPPAVIVPKAHKGNPSPRTEKKPSGGGSHGNGSKDKKGGKAAKAKKAAKKAAKEPANGKHHHNPGKGHGRGKKK